MKKTRFAPSPTGFLHLGHAYSALECWNWCQRNRGEMILRIEDIDHTRCRPHYVDEIFQDLHWMGLDWETPVRFQSQHSHDYALALEKLKNLGVLYPCFCSRKDIERALGAPHVGEHTLYPGTCRELDYPPSDSHPYTLRLHIQKAMNIAGSPTWQDEKAGTLQAQPELLGDVVVARKDIGTSYHLSVVVDDALQGVDSIIRGKDLFEATHIHRLLQALLNLPTPLYHHHDLLLDEQGQRMAKRAGGTLIRTLREEGQDPRKMFDKIKLSPQ